MHRHWVLATVEDHTANAIMNVVTDRLRHATGHRRDSLREIWILPDSDVILAMAYLLDHPIPNHSQSQLGRSGVVFHQAVDVATSHREAVVVDEVCSGNES